jgi:hypothetical protein
MSAISLHLNAIFNALASINLLFAICNLLYRNVNQFNSIKQWGAILIVKHKRNTLYLSQCPLNGADLG